ncbi:hypothetical protein B0A48_03719 [Cryoendolithus antarcticus]|uniref:F-box domain-containing protein n=1 Tax=Cryoendolithus antarcticus TaxID=1507870 RepID=A0A1V8TGB5_9PEZI|nr:hypothetical protein B0A48_03719 [Cryoendolithus antarcticus]
MAGVKRKGEEPRHTRNSKAKSVAKVAISRVTRRMARSAAGHAVFATTELVEIILLHLPFFSLVAVQRVSTAFRDCVARSHKLQTKLFLEPSKDPPERWVAEGRRQHDGLVQWRFAEEHHVDGDWCDTLPDDPSRVETPHLLCPILDHEECAITHLGKVHACNASIDAPFLRSRPDFNLASPGSWCNMYVTDPPCTKIWIEIKYKCWSNARRISREVRFRASRIVSNANGITFGELFERAAVQPGNLNGYVTKGCASTEGSEWQLFDYEDFDMPVTDMSFADVADGEDWRIEPTIEDKLHELWRRFPGIWTIDAAKAFCIIYSVVPSEEQWQAVHQRASEQSKVQVLIQQLEDTD